MEDELARGRRGVDLLLQRHQGDATLLEQLNHVEELAQGSPEPVEPHHHEGVAGTG